MSKNEFFGYIEDVTYVETVLKNSSKEEVTKFLSIYLFL